MSERIASAVFDSRDEAERAVTELRSAGVRDSAISIIGRTDGKTSETDGGGDDVNKSGAVKGALAGAGAGTLLGIAALAIPGVGPLVAAGAIAASAIPTAAAIGAGAGLAAGGVAGLLADHGVDEEDSRYFEDRIHQGGIFVSVDTNEANVPAEQALEILQRNGGHSASQPRVGATA